MSLASILAAVTDAFASAFRNYETDGVPASGAHKVGKADARQLAASITAGLDFLSDTFLDVIVGTGNIYDTKAHLDADLVPASNVVARVIADGTPANNGYYKKVGATTTGSWTFIGADPAVAASAAAEGFADDAEGFKDDAETAQAAAEAAAATISGNFTIATNDEIAFAVVDDYGFALAYLTVDGQWVTTIDDGGAAGLPTGDWSYGQDIIVIDGQSLATGYANSALTTAQAFNTKMLSGGVRTYPTSATYGSQTLVDLVEANVSGEGETPASGMADAINELVAAENGLGYADNDFALVAIVPAVASTAIASHAQGSTIYTRAMAAIDRILALSSTPTSVRTLAWMQGEQDYFNGTPGATYQAALIALRAAWDADVKAKTGQAEDLQLLSYQTSSHNAYGVATPVIALAQLAAADADPNIHIVTPLYFMDHADIVHLAAISDRWAGAYKGLAYKRIIIDGLEWKPLRPLSKLSKGAECIVVFDVPVAPLVFDTVQVVDPGDYGFQLVDSGGSPLTISSVELAGPTRVKITASSTLPAGFKVRYAFGPGGTYNSGRITGARGCLRDSAGNQLVFDPSGIAKPMHNWCVYFEL